MKRNCHNTRMRRPVLCVSFLIALTLLLSLCASAAQPTYASSFDGTTSDISFGLMVTEFCCDTSITNSTSVNVDTDTSCYQYIEIYNGGDTAVNLYDLAIVATADPISATSTSNGWKYHKGFKAENGGKKITLAPGPIYNQVAGLTAPTDAKLMVENPQRAAVKLEPGEFGIIWFWSSECATVSTTEGACLGANASGRAAAFPRFRDHYAKLMNIQQYVDGDKAKGLTEEYEALEDLPIVVAMANESLSDKVFDLDHTNRIYALVDKSFDIEASIEDNILAGQNLYCEFGFTLNSRHGIIAKVQDAAIAYVPSNATPDLLNELAKFESEMVGGNFTPTLYDDYVQAGKSLSYFELGMLSTAETPTIGSMNALQWLYVDPDEMEQKILYGDTYAIADWAIKESIHAYVDGELVLANNWRAAILADAIAEIRGNAPGDSVDREEETPPVHQHVPATEWSHLYGYHYRICTADDCDAMLDFAQCSGGTATCTSAAVCSVCQNSYGSPTGHIFSDEWSREGDIHYRACIVPGCEARADQDECHGGLATCQTRAKCDVCRQSYGAVGNHIYDSTWNKNSAGHYQVCSVTGCGAHGNEGAHDYTSDCDTDCNTCAQARAVQAHHDTNGDGNCDSCGLDGAAVGGFNTAADIASPDAVKDKSTSVGLIVFATIGWVLLLASALYIGVTLVKKKSR